ncbi:MAG: prevent-host-death family protein [Anaerolineae bacterium]|nr:prevent-host-death family protein [Anaerolineae bacterium]
MLDQVQLIKENDRNIFAVIPFEEYLFLQELLNDEEKLADYLDYLHVQKVKTQTSQRFSLGDVRRELALESK